MMIMADNGSENHCKLLQLTFVFIRVGEALWKRIAGTGQVNSGQVKS